MDMAVCPVQKNVFFETAADFSGTDATYLIHRRLVGAWRVNAVLDA